VDDLVVLRPARESDLPLLDRLFGDPEATGEFGWYGWMASPWRRRWEENRLLGEDLSTLMVVHGDQRVGFVQWHRRPTSRTSCCWQLGIALLPEARGRGYGTCAHRLLARYLFAHTQAHRLEASTEVGNIAEQRALEKAGFTREGIMRGCGWRDGAWRDGVTYSLLRTDPMP
jgi:RimJ/RimL family protein N-acetyltransferase